MREIAELEARLKVQKQEFHEKKLAALKPQYLPGDLRKRKSVIPYARANLRSGSEGPEVEVDA